MLYDTNRLPGTRQLQVASFKLPVRQNFFHKLVTCNPVTCNFLYLCKWRKTYNAKDTEQEDINGSHPRAWMGNILCPSLFFYRGEGVSITLNRYLGYCFVPLLPDHILHEFSLADRTTAFPQKSINIYSSNIVLVMLLGASLHFWQDFHRKHLSEPVPKALKELQESLPKPPRYVFIARDMMLMALTVALSVAIKMTGGWYETENEKQELKKAQAEAELQNLKSQLNPHFLFNTLNNIYSLIAINQDKAQYAVHDLSRMLRHVLYENNQHFVSVDKEFEFMKSYIELMSLRLPKAHGWKFPSRKEATES
ncbi:MAG: sensor histidine kinase [Butyricimonas faecihominis]